MEGFCECTNPNSKWIREDMFTCQKCNKEVYFDIG